MGTTLRAAALWVGLAGLLLSAGGIWFSVLSSPTNYCYHTADGMSCFHDIQTCEGEAKLDGEPVTAACQWEDDPFAESQPGKQPQP